MSRREEAGPILNGLPTNLPDIDPDETAEWIESLDAVAENAGRRRARYLMLQMLQRSRQLGVGVPSLTATDYINTIPPEREPWFPGDEDVERRFRAYLRWNSAIMVHRAQRPGISVGGHISSYASSSTLYEVGFNHFFRGPDHEGGGDQIYFQGHASPGVYARAYLEGRMSEQQLDGFRQELSHPAGGLPSYPHPRLMPDFWQFPTVSMGLGPMNAIYQAQFNKYLQNRGIKDTSQQHVWAFLGDGEMDEPESRGLLQVAANEELDNLTFVINCNLQRLDGPVRGNGKIIQELESHFRGAGWNVIKVVWGREWDPLLAKDNDAALVHLMNSTPDGDYQTYRAENGAFIREHFFGRDPRTRKMVEDLSDDQIWSLKRGGHDYRKVFAAYSAAVEHTGQPTVVLAKTIKGYGLGANFAGRNATHQMKKLTLDDLKTFRDGLRIPVTDAQLEENPYLPPYYHPGADSEETQYLLERRRALGGSVPQRRTRSTPVTLPGDDAYKPAQKGSGKQQIATTMAFVRILKELMRDKEFGRRIVPIIPDEARTFGMDSFFPTIKIYNPHGQQLHLRRPRADAGLQGVDAGPDPARRHQRGRLDRRVHRGRHVVRDARRADDPDLHLLLDVRVPADRRRDLGRRRPDEPRLPDRRHRRAHHADRRGPAARRRPLAAAGRRRTRPSSTYDPAYVLRDRRTSCATGCSGCTATGHRRRPRPRRHVLHDGLQRADGAARRAGGPRRRGRAARDVPAQRRRTATPAGRLAAPAADGVRRRRAVGAGGPGAAGQGLRRGRRRVVGDVVERAAPRRSRLRLRRLRRPARERRVPRSWPSGWRGATGPVVAVSDYMRAVPDQVRQYVPNEFVSLGADGFGLSDTRPAVRRHFKIDGPSVAYQALRHARRARRGRRRRPAPGLREVPARRRHRRHLRQRGRRRLTAPLARRLARQLAGQVDVATTYFTGPASLARWQAAPPGRRCAGSARFVERRQPAA